MKEKDILKYIISSILCYLIAKNVYTILATLLLWSYRENNFSNEILWIALSFMLGLIPLFILIYLFNRFLKANRGGNSRVLLLLGLNVVLTSVIFGINFFYGIYVDAIKLMYSQADRIQLYSMITLTEFVFPVIALIYFMIKIYGGKERLKL